MNLRDLEYIIKLSETGHFGRAAEECNVSQPALSMQIKKLEEFLDVQIFERINKKVLLTPIGETIIKQAKLTLIESNKIKEIANVAKDPYSGRLRIGAFPTLAPYIFPKIVPNIHKKYKNLKLYLIEEKTDILIEKLHNAEIDIALLAMPVEHNGFEHIKLFDDEFFIAVNKAHKLANNKTINTKELLEENILLLSEGHCLREQAISFCAYGGIKESGDFKATSMETLKQMVVANMGVTFVPKTAISDDKNIKYLKIASSNKASTSREIALFYRKSVIQSELFNEIADIIKNDL